MSQVLYWECKFSRKNNYTF